MLLLRIKWIDCSYETQVALVRNAWSDIFVLGMAQCASSMNLQSILATLVGHLQASVSQEKLSAQRVRQVTSTICKVQEFVRAAAKMQVDTHEFAYLKIISLFATGKYYFKCDQKPPGAVVKGLNSWTRGHELKSWQKLWPCKLIVKQLQLFRLIFYSKTNKILLKRPLMIANDWIRSVELWCICMMIA